MEGVGFPGKVWEPRAPEDSLNPLDCLQADFMTCIRPVGDFSLDGREAGSVGQMEFGP